MTTTSVLPPVEDPDGWFRQCERCRATTEDPFTNLFLVRSCALLGATWLCSWCRDDHRRGCPICKAAILR